MIDRNRLAELNAIELETFAARNPKSNAAYAKADHLFGRVPMTWSVPARLSEMAILPWYQPEFFSKSICAMVILEGSFSLMPKAS